MMNNFRFPTSLRLRWHLGPLVLGVFLLAIFISACNTEEATETAYVPKAILCASSDTADTLCPVIPSSIGPDAIISRGNPGYSGLSNDVNSFDQDVQTPFDNMSWQMFVALNWQADQLKSDPKTGLSGAGTTVWQTYSRPEKVFGGTPGTCPNPNDLPRFDIIAKSGAKGSSDEEILQATGQPLIDVNGNWTLFERRMNEVEESYITSNNLNTYEGQKSFIENNQKVELPPGDHQKTDGKVGAIEIKASWRILKPEEKPSYFNIQGLIDVEGEFVRDQKPLCQEVTLGLVGLHIIQNNPKIGDLLPQFVWASFEHKENAPLAKAACDPVDSNCYKTISNNVCMASLDDKSTYSFYSAKCADSNTNVPPKKPDTENVFLWERNEPYAKTYMTTVNGNSCGTQVTRCWQVYKLTQELNKQWQARLAEINSVFANYFLIGTNWGGNIEPERGKFTNNSVPAFLGNSTLETYIQASTEAGSCVTCHSNATLAYKVKEKDPDKTITYPADFSFFLGIPNPCKDIDAGPIFNQAGAEKVCPGACSKQQRSWNGQWKTTSPGRMSVCGCCVGETDAGLTSD